MAISSHGRGRCSTACFGDFCHQAFDGRLEPLLRAAHGPRPDLCCDNLWFSQQLPAWALEWCYEPRFNLVSAMLGEFVVSGVFHGMLTQLVPLKALEWFSELRFLFAGVIVKQFASCCWPSFAASF